MPKGQSGRVVIEVDPTLKRRLYSALAIENSTLKDWFISTATEYLADRLKSHLPRTKNKEAKRS